ncbi:hypothetical protein [Pedobacter gandavensis]|uniref:hypothetical protein n=1 Tax=Pedobacter gandavensis TaxID=2679963 RepID=UPI00292E3FFC|nr:hypothetical protein [Pedobacter gandavensis]
MEVPDETHLSHRAEYNETKKGFPKAPSPKGPFSSHKAVASPSARAKFLQWVNEAKTRTMDILHAIAIFNESLESEVNKEVRIELINKLSESLQYFKRTLATKLNYEGLTYNKDTNIDKDVQSIRGLLGVANDELIHFKALLAHPDSEQRLLEYEAHK